MILTVNVGYVQFGTTLVIWQIWSSFNNFNVLHFLFIQLRHRFFTWAIKTIFNKELYMFRLKILWVILWMESFRYWKQNGIKISVSNTSRAHKHACWKNTDGVYYIFNRIFEKSYYLDYYMECLPRKFVAEEGVRQGRVLNPLLFNLIMDDVITDQKRNE